MSKNDVTVECARCGKPKIFIRSEYNRKIRNDTPFYCSGTCSSKAVYFYGHLKHAPKVKIQLSTRSEIGSDEYLSYRTYNIEMICIAKNDLGHYGSDDWIRESVFHKYPELRQHGLSSEDIIKVRENRVLRLTEYWKNVASQQESTDKQPE